MPKRISKKEEETFFFDPGEKSTLIIPDYKYTKEEEDFFNSLLPKTKMNIPKVSKEDKKYWEIMNNPKISIKAKGHLKRNTKNGTILNMSDLLAFEKTELFLAESDSDEEITKKVKKTYKESNLMKARSDLKKKGDKYTVDTDMNIKKGLEPKIKKALKKSITEELDKKLKGSSLKGIGNSCCKNNRFIPNHDNENSIRSVSTTRGNGIRKIKLDLSSSEDEKPKKRGRPKKGKGLKYDSESSSDEEDFKEFSKLLKHLIKHITDIKESNDPNDAKQAKELIDKLISKKR